MSLAFSKKQSKPKNYSTHAFLELLPTACFVQEIASRAIASLPFNLQHCLIGFELCPTALFLDAGFWLRHFRSQQWTLPAGSPFLTVEQAFNPNSWVEFLCCFKHLFVLLAAAFQRIFTLQRVELRGDLVATMPDLELLSIHRQTEAIGCQLTPGIERVYLWQFFPVRLAQSCCGHFPGPTIVQWKAIYFGQF